MSTSTVHADPRNYGGAGGLRLWLDPTDVSTLFQNSAGTIAAGTGNPVVRWNDKSGQGNNFINPAGSPTGITLIAGVIGGQNVVNFNNGGTQGLTDSTGLGIAANQARTLFFMTNHTTGNSRGNNEVFGTSTGTMVDLGNGVPGGVGTVNFRLRTRDTSSGSDLGALSAANSVPSGSNLVSLTADAFVASVSGGISAERNATPLTFTRYTGASVNTGPAITAGQYQHYNMTVATHLGWSSFSGRGFVGNVGEVLIYNSDINAAELNLVNNYLSAKYSGAGAGAVPLAAGRDFYRGDNSAFGNYDFNVFGIGRANAIGLNNAGAVTSDGFDRGLQLTELNSSLGAGEFVLAGDLNTANTIETTLLPAGVDERWGRTWFVDANSGGVDLQMIFDFADAGMTWDPNTLYSLLVAQADGGPFTLASVSGYSSSPGVVSFDLTGANALSNFGYFTIGATAIPEPTAIAIWMLLGALAIFTAWKQSPRLAKGPRQ